MTSTCPRCSLPAKTEHTLEECISAQRQAMSRLLRMVGDIRTCSGCGEPIFWLVHRATGARTPYTEAGLNHFINCTKAEQFRKQKGAISHG